MGVKIDRSAFLYLEPTDKSYGSPEKYAQCATCMMWTGEQNLTCTIHGDKETLEVGEGDTCGFYVNGMPMPSMAGKEHASVRPQESGFERRQVRCENCRLFTPKEGDRGICEGYKLLNEDSPDNFDMDMDVAKHGCCNANVPIEQQFMNQGGLIGIMQKKFSIKQLLTDGY